MHSVPDPSRVRFTGPLSDCAAALVEELARLGYTTTSATNVMQLAAHLSRWLGSEGIDLGEVSGGVIDRFLAVRRATYAHHYSGQALRPVLAYLRREGVVPAVQAASAASSPVELLLVRYRRYLVVDRGLTGPVADAYTHWVTPFVRDVAGTEPAAIGNLAAVDVAGFLTTRLPSMTRKTAQMTACALRSFLRFLARENLVETDLADAVPAVAHRRLSGLPEPLSPAQILGLLGACDRSTATGPAGAALRRSLRARAGRHRLASRGRDRPGQGRAHRPAAVTGRRWRRDRGLPAGGATGNYGRDRVRDGRCTACPVGAFGPELHRCQSRQAGGAGNDSCAPAASHRRQPDSERRGEFGGGLAPAAACEPGDHCDLRED